MGVSTTTRVALEAVLAEAYKIPGQAACAMILGEEVQCRISQAARGMGRPYWKLNGNRVSDRSLQRSLAWTEGPPSSSEVEK